MSSKLENKIAFDFLGLFDWRILHNRLDFVIVAAPRFELASYAQGFTVSMLVLLLFQLVHELSSFAMNAFQGFAVGFDSSKATKTLSCARSWLFCLKDIFQTVLYPLGIYWNTGRGRMILGRAGRPIGGQGFYSSFGLVPELCSSFSSKSFSFCILCTSKVNKCILC